MRVSTVNDVKIYTLGVDEKLNTPEWRAQLPKKKLRDDPEWDQRIELIQDFEFPEASTRLKLTEDNGYIVATGVYKPQIRVFDLAQKSMKFERHTDSETIQFEILSQDWSKIALLQNDRSVEFHAKYGMHHRMRVPRAGRDMTYDCATCELFVGGSSEQVWRIDLESGCFLRSCVTELPEINVLKVDPSHGLLAVGGVNGCAEFFHPDDKKRLTTLNVAKDLKSREHELFFERLEITAVEFCEDALSIAFGLNSGHVLLYDLRSSDPVIIQEHMYCLPIKFIGNHGKNNIASADKRSVRIWNKNTGKLFTTVEPQCDLNDVCLMGESGMFSCAVEGARIETYYLPSLGPAPSWCPYIDNFTEDIEGEEKRRIYTSYKFVTSIELERLSLSHLIGTDKLAPYMHGFFVDFKLYQKAKAIAAPFAYEEYKKSVIRQRYDKLSESRIIPPSNLPKINRYFAERVLTRMSSRKSNKESSILPEKQPTIKNPIGDPRFEKMFEDENFEIDESHPEWKLRHPSEALRPSSTAAPEGGTVVSDEDLVSD